MSLLLDGLSPLVTPWRGTVDAAGTERLASALEGVDASLNAHLGQEEEEILPIAGVSMSQKEWDKLGKHGRGSVPISRQMASLGYILDSMTPADASIWMKVNLPAPIRLLYRLIGRRQFAAEQRALHPDAA